MLSHPLGGRGFRQARRLPTSSPNGNGTASACRRRRARRRRPLVRRIYSRTGEDVSRAFPDLVEALNFEGAIDGELLIVRDGRVQSFNVLQQRLNRKTVTPKLHRRFPGAPARLRHPGRGRGGPARPALRRAAERGWRPRGAARRSAHRPLAAGALRDLGGARGRAGRSRLGRGGRGCGGHRGLHGQARRQPLSARPAQGASGTSGSATPTSWTRS